MTNNMLPCGHLERIWASVPHLRNGEKYRMLKPGGSQFRLHRDQLLDWENFTQEVKVLSNPYCKEETWKSFTARKFGQLSRYMDDHHCRYGIYTIYEHTWFLKRVDDTHFAVSQPISASSVSTSSALSLRECLLALVIAVADEERSYYPARYGKRLTTRRQTMIRGSRSPPNLRGRSS
ncbi:ankyrin repeats (3 copies) family protein [Aspergillus tubingensis]|uniref:ankyrin repeats (3 copies) family protein n=1 Tax=Aspergillus tubingensis TaxID=5068 RepID=UPI0015785754|nr:ankyrin repeats (3 copies) family protein [Aspergillus tubingensis]GFN17053.1 ankyrin repeats (3 copies) family protein [Aspergillus tubingensis]